MTNKYTIDFAKGNTVSTKLQRLVRLMQLQSPDAVIRQEVTALQREFSDMSEVVSITVTVENKRAK